MSLPTDGKKHCIKLVQIKYCANFVQHKLIYNERRALISFHSSAQPHVKL